MDNFLSYFKIFIRLLLSQAAWNIERMQNIGFVWSVLPYLKKIHTSDENSLKQSILRNLQFFNTHPYFMGIFSGLLMHWEKKNYEVVSKSKISYGGPMAALGTQFFWATLRPLAGMLAILLFFILDDKTRLAAVVTPIVFMIFFDGIAIPVRFLFIKGAAQKGLDFFYTIKRINPNKMIWYLQIIGMAAASGAVFFYYKNFILNDILLAHLFPIVVILTVLLHIFFKKISGLKIFYAVVVVSMILGYVLPFLNLL